MKIVIIGTAYPMRGGIAHYISQLYKKLIQRGHEIKIISFKRQYPSIFFPGKTQQDLSEEIEPLPSKPLLDSIGPLSWIRTFIEIYRYQPDLIIFKYWMPFFAPCYSAVSFLTRLFTRTKILYICDNIVPHESNPPDKLLTKIGLWNVHYFIVMSNTVKKSLLDYKPQANFRETPHPVYDYFQDNFSRENARKNLGLNKDDRVLLFFGYVRQYKGLHTLLKAIPLVLKKANVKLIVAGEFYDSREKYENLINELGINYAVKIYDDYIPNEKVAMFYNAADVVVLPYVSATQSGIIQIAYNYNKPVITTNVGGLPEVVEEGKTGFIVPAEDPEKLAEAIIDFFEINNPESFSNYIAEYKQQFSWDRLVSEIENFVK
ncbi:glycosyl transferase family 1 [Methanosarcinales archaeon]|nr:MAG: glycosyl transferase family 1 [Methanosarcinales archaeon]